MKGLLVFSIFTGITFALELYIMYITPDFTLFLKFIFLVPCGKITRVLSFLSILKASLKALLSGFPLLTGYA